MTLENAWSQKFLNAHVLISCIAFPSTYANPDINIICYICQIWPVDNAWSWGVTIWGFADPARKPLKWNPKLLPVLLESCSGLLRLCDPLSKPQYLHWGFKHLVLQTHKNSGEGPICCAALLLRAEFKQQKAFCFLQENSNSVEFRIWTSESSQEACILHCCNFI